MKWLSLLMTVVFANHALAVNTITKRQTGDTILDTGDGKGIKTFPIAGQKADGSIVQLQVDSSGNLKVSGSGGGGGGGTVDQGASNPSDPWYVQGTLSCNSGTNLNTSLLALESGGNLASIKSDVDNLNLSQGSTTSGQKGNLSLGAVTTSSPSYTTAQSSPLSLTTAGALRTDSSAVTQPVSGTVSITANSSVNVAQVNGVTTSTGSGIMGTGTQRVAIASDNDALTVKQGTATNLKAQAEAYQGGTAVGSGNPLQVTLANTGANATAVKTDGSAVTQPVSAASLPLPSGASTSAKQPALGTAGTASADVITVQGIASMTALKVDGSAVTQPVSGTVTANAGTNLNTSLLALESGGNLASVKTNTDNLNLSQGSTTSGQKGPIIQGAVTTAAPTYTTAQTNPLSLTTAGALRTDSSATTQPVSGTVTANAGTNLNTSALALESGGNLASVKTNTDNLNLSQASTTSGQKGNLILGAVTTAAPSYTTAQSNPLSLTTGGGLRVDGSGATQPVSGTVSLGAGAATIGALTANQSVNTAQVAGTTTSVNNGTVDAGTQRVTIASDSTGLVKLATGANTIGALTANQSVNHAQVSGTAVSVNNGTTDAGTQRVTLSSDSTGLVKLATGTNNIGGVSGDVANGSSDSGNPVKIGGVGKTANPTAVTDGQRVNALFDKLGKQVFVNSIRDLKLVQQTTITASTAETTVLTAVASTFLDVYGVIVTNTSATVTKVTFKDATSGTTRFVIEVPATETRGFMLTESAAVPQATVNNNWTATCGTSVSSVEITMLAVKNL